MRTEDIPPHWRKLPEKQALTGGGTPWCALQGHFSYMIGILPEIHFQQLLEFYLVKKVYKWGCANTHYSIYFARTVSPQQYVNQVFQNCHVCIFFCKCLSLHQSLQQKERKHSGWSALLVKAVAKRGSLLTHSSTEVPEQVHSGVKVVHLTTHSKIIISTAGALVYRLRRIPHPLKHLCKKSLAK